MFRTEAEKDRRFKEALVEHAMVEPGPPCVSCKSTQTVSFDRLEQVWKCLTCDGADFTNTTYEGGLRRDDVGKIWGAL